VILRFAYCLLAFACLLETSAGQEAAPRLVFTKKLYDFGDTIQGRTVHHVFTFKNIGKAPLKIFKVNPSCACALLKSPTEEIGPGETGEVEVAFETDAKVGFQTVHIIVYSNDSSQSDRGANTTVLRVRGEITTLYKISPPVVGLGRITQGLRSKARLVHVQAKGKRGFKILKLKESSQFFDVTWKPSKSSGYDIAISVKADAPIGEINKDLIFTTDLKRQPHLRIPVYSNVATIYDTPPVIFMDRGKVGLATKIPILRYKGVGLQILGIDYDRKRFTMGYTTMNPGKRVDLIMTVRPDAVVGPFAGEVIVRLANKQQPLIRIPVLGNIRSVFNFEPQAVFVQKAVKVKEILARIEITGSSEVKAKLIKVLVTGCPASARLEQKGDRRFIVVESQKDAKPADFASGKVTLTTAVFNQKVIEIPFLVGK
jgi:hypothetical protein